MEVDSIVADKAYSSKENLKMAKENNMHLSARLSSVIDGNRTNKLPLNTTRMQIVRLPSRASGEMERDE